MILEPEEEKVGGVLCVFILFVVVVCCALDGSGVLGIVGDVSVAG